MEDTIAPLGLLDDEALVLDVSALNLAALDHPGVDLAPYLHLLGEIADHVADLADYAVTTADKAEALSKVIAGEFGFTGDQFSYDDPDNADLIRVIDRRRGLPVSLTILYVAAARRIGFDADVLNTPGHVLGRIGGETDSVLIDPFGDGRIVDPDDLAALVARVLGPGATPSSEHLQAMANRGALVRLLTNQASRAEAAGDTGRALTLYERMSVVAPEYTHLWWDRARLQLIEGDVRGARASLGAMLETTRDPDLRNHVCAVLDSLAPHRN